MSTCSRWPTPGSAERACLDQGGRWWDEEGGHEHLQRTRPLSAAYALDDSPVGLLGWLLKKYHPWTGGGAGLGDHVVHYTRMPRGGHFAAREEPDLPAGDIRSFVRRISI